MGHARLTKREGGKKGVAEACQKACVSPKQKKSKTDRKLERAEIARSEKGWKRCVFE